MSGSTLAFNPPPERIGSLRAGDTDSRYLNFTPYLGPLSDTIVAINSVTVSRRDGATLSGSDLQVMTSPNPALDATRLFVIWWLTGGIVDVDYEVSVSVISAQGRTLVRDAYIRVMAALG